MTRTIFYALVLLFYVTILLWLYSRLRKVLNLSVDDENSSNNYDYILFFTVPTVLMYAFSNSMFELLSIFKIQTSSYFEVGKLMATLAFTHVVASLIGTFVCLFLNKTFIQPKSPRTVAYSILITALAVSLAMYPFVSVMMTEVLPQMELGGFR